MVRVNVRTPPSAEQPAPAPPSPGGTKSNNAVPGAGDGGQQHCKQTHPLYFGDHRETVSGDRHV